MALDEPKETDNLYTIDKYQYIVDKNFMESIKSLKVDYSAYGFRITPGVETTSSGCKSCGTEGSCCA